VVVKPTDDLIGQVNIRREGGGVRLEFRTFVRDSWENVRMSSLTPASPEAEHYERGGATTLPGA